MNRVKAIAIFELKRIFQKPESYLLMFGMPILFTFIFGGLFSDETESKPRIAIVDHDQSTLSLAFIDELERKNVINWNTVDAEIATKDFSDQKITGYIMIDQGFEGQVLQREEPKIDFVHSPSFDGAMLVKQMVNDGIVKLKIGATAANNYQDITGDSWKVVQEKISNEFRAISGGVETITITDRKELTMMNNMTARSAGFTIMFVMIMMLFSTGVFLEARQTGVWYRMMSTPTRKKELLLGYLIAFFIIGWIQFGMLMLVSRFVFHVYWGNLLGNMLLVSSLLLCTIGLGLFIAGLVKTTEQQSVFGILVIVSTCMLGGVYWPIEIMPNFMQQVATFVPQYWGLEGFQVLAARGGTVIDVLIPSSVLLAFTAVFLLIGMTRIRFE